MNEGLIRSYLDIIDIRRRGARRNMLVIGTVFILALLAFFTLGMIGFIEGLELFVISSMLIAFAFGFIHSLIRFETIKAVHEFGSKFIQDEGAAYR